VCLLATEAERAETVKWRWNKPSFVVFIKEMDTKAYGKYGDRNKLKFSSVSSFCSSAKSLSQSFNPRRVEYLLLKDIFQGELAGS